MNRGGAGRGTAVVLTAAFALIHVLVGWLGWVLPNQPMGDVVLVYEPWARAAAGGGGIVGINEAWVYPQLALIPMLIALGISGLIAPLVGPAADYLVAWAVLVTVLDVIAFAFLLGRRATRSRNIAAAFWCLALVMLGPIALYRIDAITVPLVVVGGLLLVRRPVVAGILLTVGAWIKIWPGALLAAGVVLFRQRMPLLIAAVATSAVVAIGVLAMGGGLNLFGFLTQQTGRGLQVEAVAATPFLWAAVAGHASIEYSFEILTYQVEGVGVEAVSAIMTPLLVVAFAALLGFAAWRLRGGASALRLFPPLVLAIVTALIVFNKVGSPQFQTWLIAPIIVWLVWDRRGARVPAVIVLVLCALTFFVYPLFYGELLGADAVVVAVLTLRNVLLIALLVVCVRGVQKVPIRHG